MKRRSRVDVLRSAQASSLAEFAISLPLLVVLVVGIFDFGGAFNQKQELNTAMREGARFGASQPTNDLVAGSAPPSINAIRYLVDAYLLNSNINDCGLATAARSTTGPPWTYNAPGCPGGLALTIYKDPELGGPESHSNMRPANVGGHATDPLIPSLRARTLRAPRFRFLIPISGTSTASFRCWYLALPLRSPRSSPTPLSPT